MPQASPSNVGSHHRAKPDKNPSTGLPPLYKAPRRMDSVTHGKLSLQKNVGFGFASAVNSLPLNAVEIVHAAKHYPVVFSDGEVCTPIAIVGLRNAENLFVDADGHWESQAYVPAYVRRYPFIVSKSDGGETLNLCIDENDEFIEEGDAQPFFVGEKPSSLSTNAIEFCRSYNTAAEQTAAFADAIGKADVLVPQRAQAVLEDSERVNLTGFSIIDEKKFANLSAEKFLAWREAGWLPWVYAHLSSAGNWERLHSRLKKKIQDSEADSK